MRKLNFDRYKHLGKLHKIFCDEYITCSCNDGDDPYLYYIDSGKIQICFERSDNSTLIIAHRYAGNVFQAEYLGFASISHDRLKFIALENSIIISFTKNELFALLKQDDELMDDFLYVVHMTYSTLCHRLMNTSSLSSSQRFLTWLDKLCMSAGPNPQGHYVIPCHLTQQQIADYLFIHVSTCNKIIASLEKEHILIKTKTQIIVCDLEKLEKFLLSESKLIC